MIVGSVLISRATKHAKCAKHFRHLGTLSANSSFFDAVIACAALILNPHMTYAKLLFLTFFRSKPLIFESSLSLFHDFRFFFQRLKKSRKNFISCSLNAFGSFRLRLHGSIHNNNAYSKQKIRALVNQE